MPDQPRAVVVMGVSGAGKTTVGRLLASAVGWPFYDGDDFHSPDNVARMAAGIALTDEDRRPWLAALRRLLADHLSAGQPLVLASSALKEEYRRQLSGGLKPVTYVYLKVDEATLTARLQLRADHYMPATLLGSQLAALEEPVGALVVDAAAAPDDIVRTIIPQLLLRDSQE